jgi:hypothetical protein
VPDRLLTQVMASGAQPSHACTMTPSPTIPIRLSDEPHAASVEIDGTRVARGLGLDVTEFRQLMSERRITVLCERGTGEDAGTWRASFYYGHRRARFVVDALGRPLPA